MTHSNHCLLPSLSCFSKPFQSSRVSTESLWVLFPGGRGHETESHPPGANKWTGQTSFNVQRGWNDGSRSGGGSMLHLPLKVARKIQGSEGCDNSSHSAWRILKAPNEWTRLTLLWPGGSVGWCIVPCMKSLGLGHIPRWQVWFPIGLHMGGNQSMFLTSMFLSLSQISKNISSF